MLQIVMEQLLQEDNIHLYGFYDSYDTILDFNYYNDTIHYSSEINSQILEDISQDKHRITKDNYQEYLSNIGAFYRNFDYMSLQP